MLHMKVDCYWNLHRKCISVRHKGRVIAHPAHIVLDNVKFVVSQAGRARVLREKRKNVHALVRGTISAFADVFEGEAVTYNPYKYASFVKVDGEVPVSTAKKVRIGGKKIFAIF